MAIGDAATGCTAVVVNVIMRQTKQVVNSISLSIPQYMQYISQYLDISFNRVEDADWQETIRCTGRSSLVLSLLL